MKAKQLQLEIFRPVLTYDKQEIIDVAQKIGTYETSKGPEICCLLGPKNPATKSDVEAIGHELSQIDLQKLLVDSLAKAEVLEQ